MYTFNKLNLLGMITFALIGFCLLTLNPAFAAINTDNITALWLFDEGEGTTATDSSGNGNDGTIHGATWVDGKFGQALEFNGTDNWVEVPHSQTVSLKLVHHSRLPFISKEQRSVVHSPAKTMKIQRKSCHGTCYGMAEETTK